MESVVSVAVKVAEPPTVDDTAKVATPEAEVTADAGEMVSVAPHGWNLASLFCRK